MFDSKNMISVGVRPPSTPSAIRLLRTNLSSAVATLDLFCELYNDYADGVSGEEVNELVFELGQIEGKLQRIKHQLTVQDEHEHDDRLSSCVDLQPEIELNHLLSPANSCDSEHLDAEFEESGASFSPRDDAGAQVNDSKFARFSSPLRWNAKIMPGPDKPLEAMGVASPFITRRSFGRKRRATSDNVVKAAQEAFNLIDVNGDGFLQKEEVLEAVKQMQASGFLDPKIDTEEMATSMMNEVDADGDGQIDIHEFVKMMRKKKSSALDTNRMSLLAKNVLVAHQKKLEKNIIGNDLWMINPMEISHAIWDIAMSLLITVNVITLPLTLGWEEMNSRFFVMNLTFDFIFILDIVKNFCTGFIDENDAVIMDAKTVRKNYLTGFFLSDVLSSVPLDFVLTAVGVETNESVSGTKRTLKMLRLLKLAKLFRLLRISRMFRYIKIMFVFFEETLHIRISDGFMKLLRLMTGALFLAHWIGCFNFMLVRFNDYPEDSWVVYAGLQYQSPYTQWSWSFFKALAQMIMIGFETPPFTNASCDAATDWCSIEHWITLACLYLGAVFYSLLISSISSIIQTASLASRQFEEKLIQLDDYMRSKRLPSSLREKVKDYFHLQHADGKLFNEPEILDMVTPILRREIQYFNGRGVADKIPMLSSVAHKFFAEELATVIESTIAFTDEVLMKERTVGEEMYFINSGVVDIYLDEDKKRIYCTIGDGCFFGEVSILLGIRRTASVKTRTQCILYKVTKENLLNILKDFPESAVDLKRVADIRRRRLARHLHSGDGFVEPLLPGEEVDSEDRKTDLFGLDADQAVNSKAESFENNRRQARIKKRPTSYGVQTKQPSPSSGFAGAPPPPKDIRRKSGANLIMEKLNIV